MTLLLIKPSRLAPFQNRTNLVKPGIRITDRSKTGPKKCPQNDHLKTGRSGIRIIQKILNFGTLHLHKQNDLHHDNNNNLNNHNIIVTEPLLSAIIETVLNQSCYQMCWLSKYISYSIPNHHHLPQWD
jgi:hypothetical protein